MARAEEIAPGDTRTEDFEVRLDSTENHPHLVAPGNGKNRWKRAWILSWVAFAAANVLDAHSSSGRQELNPLLRGRRGTFSAGKATVIKSAAGGGFFALQWWLARKSPDKNYYKSFTIGTGAAAAGLGTVAIRNYGVNTQLTSQNQSTVQPEYLKR